ncbi:hypothetical protein Ana3638_20080 [Anaerocolumna sedimenticola]|uniref:Uncharacterized protein n=1 Tax=Anaerocolumna sedimenticola TaxID=2696063 RepID=A0A6P1TP84_9FIRM|nr:hypothetical protein [Anaerocolumna sedimenticola]QHQ62794.1 hypothetical protein Ana3638_20080 [Anaerocolumna sedimenticola]
MNDNFFNNQFNDNENNNDFTSNNNRDIIESNVIISDVKPKKKHKFLKNLSKIVVSAAVFGLVAGASFQGYYALSGLNNSKGQIVNSAGDNSKGGLMALLQWKQETQRVIHQGMFLL